MKIRNLKDKSSLHPHAHRFVTLLGVSASFDGITHDMCVQGSVCGHGMALRAVSLSSQEDPTARTDIRSLFSRLDRVF